MGKISWTSEQEEAISSRGRDLLVSAAAGSGKTAVLVARVIDLITKDKVNIDEMLISTFTNAAAAEMCEKIYKKLQTCGLDEQIERMGHASISSLDSFALSIVKRYYHLVGVDPQFSVCDKTASALLKEEALDDMFDGLFEEKNEDFLFFLDCYDTRDKDDYSVREMLLRLHDFLMSMPDPEEYIKRSLSSGEEQVKTLMRFAGEQAMSLLARAREYFVSFTNKLEENGLSELAAKSCDRIGFIDSISELLSKDTEAGLRELCNAPKYANISFKKAALKDCSEDELKAIRQHGIDIVKAVRESYGALSEELLAKERAAMEPALKILFSLVRSFDRLYSEKKRLAKAFDFSDLKHFALKILENEDACREYREQFKYIFIDEFQDTNSIQEAIIKRISRGDNLFMVGDVKQSIYKFRLAEPEIFLAHYEAFRKGGASSGRLIDLNMNFRSKKSVIDCVNEVFSNIMTLQSCGMDYDDAAALKLGSSYSGALSYPADLRILDSSPHEGDDAQIAELKKNELEALQIASMIKEYHGKLIHDDEAGKDRPLEYRDMVILLRSTKSRGELIYRALLEADIPVYLDRSEGYFDSMEIQVFLNLLRIIDNKDQDIALLSVLCCPVFGYSADELAEIRLYGNEVLKKADASFSEVFFEYAKQNAKASEFENMLLRFQRESRLLPLAELIYKILLTTGYVDFASAQNGGEQKLANLRALVDKAEKYERDNISGLTGFIRFAEVLARNSRNIDIGPAKTVSEAANCVRIMTIHKSKGLEFPFVLAAGLVGKALSASDSSSYAFHKEYGCAIRPVNPNTRNYADTKLLYLLNQKKKEELLAEEIRLMYVAMTRAKDILAFSACKNLSPQNRLDRGSVLKGDVASAFYHLDLIYPVLKDRARITDKNILAAFTAGRQRARESFRARILSGWAGADDEEVLKIMGYPYFPSELPPKKKYSVSELAEKARTGMDSYSLAYSEDEALIPYDIPKFIEAKESGVSAADRGTAYHTVMEHIPFREEFRSVDAVRAFIDGLAASNILTVAQAECVDEYKIKAFFDSDTGRRALACSELHRESPFVMKHEHMGHSVLVQGTVDCYFKEDGKYVLVDYKSNYVDRENESEAYERLRESYLPQLALYKEAMEKISGIEVKEMILYLFGTGKELHIKE